MRLSKIAVSGLNSVLSNWSYTNLKDENTNVHQQVIFWQVEGIYFFKSL